MKRALVVAVTCLAGALAAAQAQVEEALLNAPIDRMVLIDHSRAFASDRMPFEKEMTRIDRAFFEKLKALDEASVMKQVRPWLLDDGAARAILERRDKIVKHFEKAARKKGEAVVFPF